MLGPNNNSLIDIEQVRNLGNINVDLLVKFSDQGHPDAMRELARYIQKNTNDSKLLKDAWALLLIAARSADRGASWLMALYYRDGRYGFKQDLEKSEYWRKRTEDRLASDAALIYDDEHLAYQAKRRYALWQFQWKKILKDR